jgi:hypothetical protein
MESFGPSAA